jgi:hypothetical protein
MSELASQQLRRSGPCDAAGGQLREGPIVPGLVRVSDQQLLLTPAGVGGRSGPSFAGRRLR